MPGRTKKGKKMARKLSVRMIRASQHTGKPIAPRGLSLSEYVRGMATGKYVNNLDIVMHGHKKSNKRTTSPSSKRTQRYARSKVRHR